MPLPWAGTEPPFGFSPAGATADPWLPQPKEWRDLTVGAESARADSMLALYRAALRIRRSEPAFGTAPLTWRSAPNGVIAFDRLAPDAADLGGTVPGGTAPGGTVPGGTVTCVANLSGDLVGLPPHASVLLASGPLDGGLLPPDTTAWLRL